MPSSRSLLLFLLCGCNQVLGLDGTRRYDAAFFDAPIPQCPPLGTAPVFSRSLHQTLFQSCVDYTVSSTGQALASCGVGIYEGSDDATMLQLAPGFTAMSTTVFKFPRIHAEGKLLAVRVTDLVASSSRIGIYTRGAAGWMPYGEIPADIRTINSTALTRNGRILVVRADSLREYLDDGNGNFSELPEHTRDDLGVTDFTNQTHLSPDGLRLIFTGIRVNEPERLLYSDRPDVTARFRTAVPLPDIDYFPAGVMTEDCRRLYFWDLGTVFYSELR